MSPGKLSLSFLCLIFVVRAENEDVIRLLQEIRINSNKYPQLLQAYHTQAENDRRTMETLRHDFNKLSQNIDEMKQDLKQVKETLIRRNEKYQQTETIMKNMETFNRGILRDLTQFSKTILQVSEKSLRLLNTGASSKVGTSANQIPNDVDFETRFSQVVTESFHVNLRSSLNPEFEKVRDLMEKENKKLQDAINKTRVNCEDRDEETKLMLQKGFKNLTEFMETKMVGEKVIANKPKVIKPENEGNPVPEEVIGLPDGAERNFFQPVIIAPSTTTEPIKCNPTSNAHEPKNCAELRKDGVTWNGVTCDGVYPIYLNPESSQPRLVSCDMSTDGGGWTVIARRDDYGKKSNFNKNWKVYQKGFGITREDFWLGNNNIHRLTSQEKNELRVELQSFSGERLSLTYNEFYVGNATSKFMVKIGDVVEGDDEHQRFGQSFKSHDGQAFSTNDENNSGNEEDCGKKYKAGWWYKSDTCFEAIVTGPYFQEGEYREEKEGIIWQSWKDWQVLKSVEMKVRPVNFNPEHESNQNN